MLREIRCERFRTASIKFSDGLNVVLGDDNATNSIGKSSLLMVIDFAFGGSSFVEHNTDAIQELGHHDYDIVFEFAGVAQRYRRGTFEPDSVYKCDEAFRPQAVLALDEYTGLLRANYGIELEGLSFRALVGLYSRVWGKDNLNVKRPLHAAHQQSAATCVNNLIKTFGLFGEIQDISTRSARAVARRKTLNAAKRQSIVPRVTKTDYSANTVAIADLESELSAIKADLAKYATNISELVNREVLELKLERDKLVRARTDLNGRLRRSRENLANHRHIKSKHFTGLVELFPEIDQDRLAAVEEFHSGLARILRAELRASQKDLEAELERLNEAIKSIESQMAATLDSVDEPTHLVDRVYDVSTALERALEENQRYEGEQKLKAEISRLQEALSSARQSVLATIQKQLNEGMRTVVDQVFGPERKSPEITLGETNYSFEVFEDTGTGTAYSSLLVFDLTVFARTPLPVVIHDSVLFKNIENDSVARLIEFYPKAGKQSFIALDEVDKYGSEAADMLRERRAIQLDDNNLLYDLDWRVSGA